MKFNNHLELITYLCQSDVLGDIHIYTENGGMGTMVVVGFQNPQNLVQEIESNVDLEQLVYDFLDIYNEYIPDYIDFTIQNQNGIAVMVAESTSTSHEYEQDEIKSQIRKLLNKILFENYSLYISMSAQYKELHNQKITVNEYYLGRFDDSENEIDLTNNSEFVHFRETVLNNLSNWAKKFSDESSGGEYDMDEFTLEVNSSNAFGDNFDFIICFDETSTGYIPEFLDFAEEKECDIEL